MSSTKENVVRGLVLFGLTGLAAVVTALLFNHFESVVSPWLIDASWLSYLTLGLAAFVALHFGRSRLVYACLLLLTFLNLPLTEQLTDYETTRFYWIGLSTLTLLMTRDRGFSPRMLLSTLGILAFTALFSWQALPELELLSNPYLNLAHSQISIRLPAFASLPITFEGLIACLILLLALVRFLIRPTATHNALLFILVANALIFWSPQPLINLPVVLFLCALIFYSVLSDSFAMAFKDELTGIPSRRALMQYVHTLGRKYVVVMSDIDHFKKFNDTHGHDVGDEVLKLVASKLARVKGGGKTFRFGGEEFVILFPRHTPEEAALFVEQVRQVIENYPIVLRAKPRPAHSKNQRAGRTTSERQTVRVTCSFGIAQRTAEHPDFESVMKQADIALYDAKKAGRNCVRIANS